MGSSRLPGKILSLLAGKPVLEHVIGRVREAATFDEIAVATTVRSIDDETAKAAARFGATVVRGDEQDVLARFGLAANLTGADVIMRVTADCPLIDPDVLRAMAQRYAKGDATLVTNARHRTFPRGLDAEIFSRAALETMLSEAHGLAQREHVTPFLYANPDRFDIADYLADVDHSDLRLTLDTPEDLQLLRLIFGASEHPEQLRLQNVLAILMANPEWQNINAHIEQKKA